MIFQQKMLNSEGSSSLFAFFLSIKEKQSLFGN